MATTWAAVIVVVTAVVVARAARVAIREAKVARVERGGAVASAGGPGERVQQVVQAASVAEAEVVAVQVLPEVMKVMAARAAVRAVVAKERAGHVHRISEDSKGECGQKTWRPAPHAARPCRMIVLTSLRHMGHRFLLRPSNFRYPPECCHRWRG